MRQPLQWDKQAVPICKKLVRPSTEIELAECARVSKFVQDMETRDVDVLQSTGHDLPYIRLRYSGSRKPQIFWGKYLWAQIDLVAVGGWVGRLSHIIMRSRELFFAPRADLTNPAMARHAVESSPAPRVRQIVLGTLYGPESHLRTFFFPESMD